MTDPTDTTRCCYICLEDETVNPVFNHCKCHLLAHSKCMTSWYEKKVDRCLDQGICIATARRCEVCMSPYLMRPSKASRRQSIQRMTKIAVRIYCELKLIQLFAWIARSSIQTARSLEFDLPYGFDLQCTHLLIPLKCSQIREMLEFICLSSSMIGICLRFVLGFDMCVTAAYHLRRIRLSEA